MKLKMFKIIFVISNICENKPQNKQTCISKQKTFIFSKFVGGLFSIHNF